MQTNIQITQPIPISSAATLPKETVQLSSRDQQQFHMDSNIITSEFQRNQTKLASRQNPTMPKNMIGTTQNPAANLDQVIYNL